MIASTGLYPWLLLAAVALLTYLAMAAARHLIEPACPHCGTRRWRRMQSGWACAGCQLAAEPKPDAGSLA